MMGLHTAYDVFSIIKGDKKCTFAPGNSSPVKAVDREETVGVVASVSSQE